MREGAQAHRVFNGAVIVKRRSQSAHGKGLKHNAREAVAAPAEWTHGGNLQKLQGLNVPSLVPALVVLVFFFLYVWLRIDPSLPYHSTLSVFLVGGEFFRGFLSHSGGIMEYAAAFLAQFSQVAWLGALWLTVGATSIACVTRALLRCTDQVPIPSLPLVPVFFLLLLGNDYDYPVWPTMLGLLLSLGFALGYVHLPSRTGWLRWTVFSLASLLLCYVAGAGPCFLFAVLGALFESVVRRRSLLAVGCLCAAGAVPFGAALFLDTDLAGEFMRWGKGLALWLTVGLYLFFPIAILARVPGSDIVTPKISPLKCSR